MRRGTGRTRTGTGFGAAAAAALLLTACAGEAGNGSEPTAGEAAAGAEAAGEDAARAAEGASGEPWRLVDPASDPSDGIRVLVLHDMEGLSGQDDWRTFDHGRPEYARGQELLAADVNAVVDGLFAGGATEVHVVDGHGSGNPEPDLREDLMDERLVRVLRDEPFDAYFDLVEPGAYDAVAVVGMHAKTGSRGFASHTYTLGIEFRVNGRPITETELVGLSWGRAGVPVVFASGDDRLAEDLRTMPWIEYVTVKTATSASTAEPRPPEEARADLRAAARRAIENLADAKAMEVATPVRATLRAVPPAGLGSLEGVPGVEYDAERDAVGFTAPDMRAAYDGLTALVRVARTPYARLLFEELRTRADGEEILDGFGTALTERWLDYESGRWEPPEPSTATEGRRHHGYQ